MHRIIMRTKVYDMRVLNLLPCNKLHELSELDSIQLFSYISMDQDSGQG